MVDVQKPGDFEDDFEDLDVDTLLEDQIIPSSGNKLTSMFNAQVERKKSRTRTVCIRSVEEENLLQSVRIQIILGETTLKKRGCQ